MELLREELPVLRAKAKVSQKILPSELEFQGKHIVPLKLEKEQ